MVASSRVLGQASARTCPRSSGRSLIDVARIPHISRDAKLAAPTVSGPARPPPDDHRRFDRLGARAVGRAALLSRWQPVSPYRLEAYLVSAGKRAGNREHSTPELDALGASRRPNPASSRAAAAAAALSVLVSDKGSRPSGGAHAHRANSPDRPAGPETTDRRHPCVAKVIARREAARGSKRSPRLTAPGAFETGPIRSCAAAAIGSPGRLREPGIRAFGEASQPWDRSVQIEESGCRMRTRHASQTTVAGRRPG